jgi:hypothetical protein
MSIVAAWVAWVVKNADGEYLTMRDGLFAFTPDPMAAIHCVRKADAERLVDSDWTIARERFSITSDGTRGTLQASQLPAVACVTLGVAKLDAAIDELAADLGLDGEPD